MGDMVGPTGAEHCMTGFPSDFVPIIHGHSTGTAGVRVWVIGGTGRFVHLFGGMLGCHAGRMVRGPSRVLTE